ncbi:unnamed protein product, partial [Ectocarpus sp. 6 AP-2014]
VSNIFEDSAWARDASVRTPSVSQENYRTYVSKRNDNCPDTRRSPHAMTSACASSMVLWVFHSSEAPRITPPVACRFCFHCSRSAISRPEPLRLRHNSPGGRRLPGPGGSRSSV